MDLFFDVLFIQKKKKKKEKEKKKKTLKLLGYDMLFYHSKKKRKKKGTLKRLGYENCIQQIYIKDVHPS